MAMEEFSFFKVSLPEEFLPFLKDLETGENVDEKARVSLAIGLFVGKSVTLARAAELSGKTLTEFIGILRTFNIPWMEYTNEHFNDDQLTIDELLGSKRSSNE